MKKNSTLRWIGSLLIVGSGGLFGCDGARKNEDKTATEVAAATQQNIVEEEAEIDETVTLLPKKFDPKEGAKPRNANDYTNSVEAIKTYRSKRPKKHIHDIYFNKDRAIDILSQDGVVGLRVYRADKSKANGKPEVVVVIVGVDINGNDVKRTKPVVPGPNNEVGNYMIGISAEKCPDNCENQSERIFEQ